jgi:PDZ domain-containing protein
MALRFSKTPRLLTLFFALFFLIPLVSPVNFVVIQPGEGTPLFPKVLQVKSSDIKTYKPNGQVYLLSIWVSTADAKILGAEAVACWVREDCVLFPRSVMYKRNTTTVKEEKKALQEMKVSQSDAMSATKNYLKKNFPSVDISKLSDSSLKVSLPDTGGPSGFSPSVLSISLHLRIFCKDRKLQDQELLQTMEKLAQLVASPRRSSLPRRQVPLCSLPHAKIAEKFRRM